MTKVYILQVQGWGDDEFEFVNISAHSTRTLAEKAAVDLAQQALADDLEAVTKIEVMTVDA